jgi:hypothetical protein
MEYNAEYSATKIRISMNLNDYDDIATGQDFALTMQCNLFVKALIELFTDRY